MGRSAFPCAGTVYLSLCASGIKKCVRLDTLHYWLGHMLASVKQVHANPCATVFFLKDETTTHLDHDMQQSMYYSYVQSWKPAVI